MVFRVDEKVLNRMITNSERMPKVYRPSRYWLSIINLHLKQINTDFGSFKRTVNLRYFNWGVVGILVHQIRPIAREVIKKWNLTPVVKSRFVKLKAKVEMNKLSAFVYRIYVASLYDFVKRSDSLKMLSFIEEPLLGSPYLIKYKNKLISQDLLNAVYEFYSATKDLNLAKKLEIMELGAGYGRIAFVFLLTMPKIKYTIIDIPPALYISQEYLSKIFPRKKIFKYRDFKKFKDVKKEFESSQIRFLMAHQIDLLPKKYFDLSLSVSTLHEMDTVQIKNYLLKIDKVTKGYFYTKQWRKSRYEGNNNIDQYSYPVSEKWKRIYHKRHKIQRMFFEALYLIGR